MGSVSCAMVSSVDAVAIDQVLAAVAAIAEPGDERNVQQRRADALVDVLLGRMSNGCTTPWDTNSDDDDEVYDDAASDDADDQVGGSESEIPAGAEEVDAEETGTDESAATDADTETWTPTPTVSTAWTSMTGNCRHRRSARTRREALSDSAPTYVGAGAEIAGAGSGGVSHVTACPGPGGAAAAGGAEVVPGAVGTGGMQLRPVQVTSGSSCPRRRCSGSATPRGSSRIVPRWRRPTRSGIWLPGPARCSTGWSRTSAATCWPSPNWAGSPPGSWVRRSGIGTACARTRCAMCPRRAAIWIMSSRFPKDQPPQAISTANVDQIIERNSRRASHQQNRPALR